MLRSRESLCERSNPKVTALARVGLRSSEGFGGDKTARAVVEAAQQAFANDADRGGQAGSALQRAAARSLPTGRDRGPRNRATLEVARKLVAYLLAVGRRERDFEQTAAGGLGGFSLGDPPAGKTAGGSLAGRKEKDVLLNDDELPAGPRHVGTARRSRVFPRRPFSLFRGRQVGPKLNLPRGLVVRRWPEAAHGCLVPVAPRSIRKHSPRNGTTAYPPRHRGRAEGSLRRPLDIYLELVPISGFRREAVMSSPHDCIRRLTMLQLWRN